MAVPVSEVLLGCAVRAAIQSERGERVACGVCKKRVSRLGLNDHMRDVHGARIGKAGQHAEIRALLAEWLRDHDEFGGAHADTFTARVRAALGGKVDEPSPLAAAVLAYDAAIRSCANDPEKMSSFCSAQGDDLDALYAKMLSVANRC